jgi:hypothetical protein
MKRVTKLVLTLSLMLFQQLIGQVTEGGFPYSIKNQLGYDDVQIIEMPETPLESLITEDIERDKQKSIPFRFGYNHFVQLNLQNSGTWTTLSNGDKLWRLIIHSEDALSLNLTFDKYKLPEGAKLFIYNPSTKEQIGALTKRNNQTDGKLGCYLIDGAENVLEYYEPAHAEFAGELQLWRITHGYRNLKTYAYKSYGQSGTCNNNMNCPIGINWQNEKRSVACIVVGGNESCTGALINDVPQDGTPYFLTANHCTDGSESTWVFRFNWESPGCTNVNGPTNQSVSGSVVKAKSPVSDFALLQLNSIPPANYNVYYAGWSNLDVPSDSTVCIHHPSGDIKKISFAPGVTVSATYSGAMTWKTAEWFDGLQNGATEPGSSGSPLFDTHHRIVGQLYGGPSNCTSTAGQRHDFYGKFACSWDSGTTTATRMKEWLDPQNTGATYVDGMNAVAPVQNNTGISSVISPSTTATSCDLIIQPEVTLYNYGSNVITQVTINYNIDGGVNSVYNWTGSLSPSSSINVILPNITSPSAGSHNLNVSTSLPNGLQDSIPSNDGTVASFSIIDPTANVPLPFTEDFTSATYPPAGWLVENPDNNTTWSYQSLFAVNSPGSAGKSMRIRNRQASTGQIDKAITPFYNFNNQVAPLYLTFYHSYAKYFSFNDSLIISYTKDCGATWSTLKGFNADDLANQSGGNTTSNTAFVPSADSMWVKDSIDISAVAGQSSVRFAFTNKSEQGNTLYIDQININENLTGIIDANFASSISVFPNPAKDFLQVSFQKDSKYQVSILSTIGMVVFQETTSQRNLQINTNKLSRGVYFLQIVDGDKRMLKKICLN